jgi:hypothetical protein
MTMAEGEPQGTPEHKAGEEELAKWLVPDPSELREIKNPLLKTEIHLLGRHGDKTTATPERLLKAHERIEEMVRSGEITVEEAGTWLGRIEERHQDLIGGGAEPPKGGTKAEELESFYKTLKEGRELGPIPPNEVVAVFRQGRLGMYERFWGDKVKFLDITNNEDRETWAFLNMEAFNHDIIANPHERWKGVIDFWLTDLRDATRLLSTADREKSRLGVANTEKLIKAMMAISASARAMEVTSGSTGTYASLMSPGREGPNLDKADEWDDFLLHGHPEKLELIIDNPLIRYFYTRVLEDAGYKVPDSWRLKEHVDLKPLKYKKEIRALKLPSLKNARNKGLAQYLSPDGVGGKRGFDGYLEHLFIEDPEVKSFILKRLAAGDEETTIWSAAKLACDAFLVDKYTRWEFLITEIEKKTIDPDYDPPKKWRKLEPKVGWGGNPLTAMIQPSFLPRHIKKIWHGRDRAVLDLVDKAFHPKEFFEGNKKNNPRFVEPLVPSMVVGYKAYVRYNDAMWRFLGGSMAPEVPLWTPKTFQDEGLPKIANLLEQALGLGKNKELKALMMARIVETKALASVALSNKPGLREDLGIILDPQNREMPFLEVRKELWGPDFSARSGFLARLASGELRFIFKDTPEAVSSLQRAFVLLLTNDQTVSNQAKNTILAGVGILADIAKGINSAYLGKGGKR